MDKKFLLEQIQSFRPNEIKIEGKVTKVELIRGIFEQQEKEPSSTLGAVRDTFKPATRSGLGVVGDVAGMGAAIGKAFSKSETKDMMELDAEGREGIGDIRRDGSAGKKPTADKNKSKKDGKPSKEKDVPKPKENEGVKPKASEEKSKEAVKPEKSEEKPSGEKVQKTGLKFATDLGFKAVAINDAFKKMDEAKEIALKDMFSPEELKRIKNAKSKSWKSMTPKKFYCREKNIELGGESDTRVPCWRESEKDSTKLPNMVTKGMLSNYYTRLDEKGGEKRFKHPKSGELWIPMGARSDEIPFRYIELSPNKNAVIFKMPNNDEDVFAAPMGSKKLDFLFDTGIESPAPIETPKPKPKPETDKSDKTGEERAGELLLGINEND